MNKWLRLAWVLAIVIVCTGVDQAIKEIAQKSLIDAPPISIWNDLIRIEYIENAGAILGLGASLPIALRLGLMTAFVAVAFTATFLFTLKPPDNLGMASLAGIALIASGGLGNLLDRIFNAGMVIDYISFGIGGLRTGIMNLADMAIFFGALIFFAFYRHEPPSENAVTE